MSIRLPPGRDKEAWQVALWNADDAILSRSQRLVLMLMIEAEFNSFDPYRVVADLLAHRRLWTAVEMCRGYPWEEPTDVPVSSWHLHGDLISLRDMADGHWNVDTVYLLHEKADSAALTKLAEGWSADEVDLVADEAVSHLLGSWGGDGPAILRVWWD